MQALLQALYPCSQSKTTGCGAATANTGGQLGANVANPVDEVGMLVFPAITGNPPSTTILNKEVDCSSSSSFTVTYPQYYPYTYNAGAQYGGIPTTGNSDVYSGYQAVGLSSDYRFSDTNTTLNWFSGSDTNPTETNADANVSQLVESVDWGQCAGHQYPGSDYYGLKDIAGQGSYLSGAITEAQYLLDVNARPGATNAIIVLSDGAMTSKSWDTNPCTSAVDAATQAKAAGTIVYSIAYDSSGTCPDSPSITPLNTMKDIASNSGTFHNQPTAAGLTAAFGAVGSDLTSSRLIG